MSRVFLIIMNVTTILGLLAITVNWSEKDVINLIRKYYYGLLIFVMGGIWQFLSFYLGIPFLNIETRNHIHSVEQGNLIIDNRLTSFANEPSFLSPLLIDLMIIAFLVSKRPVKVMLLGLFVLIFSFSGGGYLNLIILVPILLIGYILFKGYKFKIKQLVIGIVILLTIIVFIFYYYAQILDLLYPVFGRIDGIFDMESHVRLFMVIMPFIWVFNEGLINVFFGYGPSSYKYLSLTEILPNGTPVHVTSNNLFADTVYELGYFGVICYALIFYRFILKSLKNIQGNKYYLFSLIITAHLITSSIYRADFMQPRFWILLFIILVMFRLGRNKEQTQS